MSELLSKTNEQDIHIIKKATRPIRPTKPLTCNCSANITKAEPQQTCSRCGLTHANQQCPAFGMDCRKCGKANHFARMCRSNPSKTKQRIRCIENYSGTDDEDETPAEVYMCNKIQNSSKSKSKDQTKDWHATLIVDGNPIKFKIDTGAQCNVISSETYKTATPNKPLLRSKTRLITFGGH